MPPSVPRAGLDSEPGAEMAIEPDVAASHKKGVTSTAISSRYVGRVFGICLAVSLSLVFVLFSNVGWGGGSYGLWALGLLVLVGAFWTGLVIYAASTGRKPSVAVLLAPIFVVAVLAVSLSGASGSARWSLSASSFDQFVADLGPPAAQVITEDDLGWPKTAPCPGMVGLYAISQCENVGVGYFFTVPDQYSLGSSSAGFAYLPDANAADQFADWDEEPHLKPLGNGWYAFTMPVD